MTQERPSRRHPQVDAVEDTGLHEQGCVDEERHVESTGGPIRNHDDTWREEMLDDRAGDLDMH